MQTTVEDISSNDLAQDCPWAAVHAQTLARAGNRVDLDDGLCSRDALRALPPGFLLAWDVRGFTKALEALPPEQQVDLARAIYGEALRFNALGDLRMLQPVAGDAALYFLPEEKENQLKGLVEALRTMKIDSPGVPLPVRAALVHVDERAVVVGSFFGPKDPSTGVQLGYGAVMGPGITRLSSILRNADEEVRVSKPIVPGLPLPIEVFSEGYEQGDPADDRLRPLVAPQFPMKPYNHVLLHAKGRVDLKDPLHSAGLGLDLFEALRASRRIEHEVEMTPLKQDDGVLHMALTGGNSVSREKAFHTFLAYLEESLGSRGIGLQSAHAHIPKPLSVRMGFGIQDGIGPQLARMVHALKGKAR
ncbi:MAG: hypothetical protein WC777_03235 [Candidatus Gracilibacteria bacterium]